MPMFSLVYCVGKFFCHAVEMARQQRESISLAKLETLRDVLKIMSEAADEAVVQCKAAKLDAIMIEGWPTLHRGLEYSVQQLRKLSGPAGKIQTLDVDAVLEDHHLEKKRKAKAVKAADDAVLKAAEAAATYAPKRKRKS